MEQEYRLGLLHPYMVAGTMNQHPRTHMAHMESEKKDNVLEHFYSLCNVVGSV